MDVMVVEVVMIVRRRIVVNIILAHHAGEIVTGIFVIVMMATRSLVNLPLVVLRLRNLVAGVS